MWPHPISTCQRKKCWNSFASSDDSSWQHQALRRVLQATAPHGLEWWSPRSSSRQAPASPVGTAQALAIPLCYLHSFANHKEQQSHLYILYILLSSKVIIIFSLCFHCDSCDIGDCRINTTQINLPAEAWCSSGPIAQQHFFSLGWAMLQSCCSVLWTFSFAFVKLWAEQKIDRAAVRLHTHADGWTWQSFGREWKQELQNSKLQSLCSTRATFWFEEWTRDFIPGFLVVSAMVIALEQPHGRSKIAS